MSKADVFIVGGGPVGLSLACELIRHGVSCRIIDQNAAPQPWSKAAGVQSRTLEVFEHMGVIEEALARGRKMYGFQMYSGETCFAKISMEVQGTAYPYLLGLSQRDTELLLAAQLQKLGGRLEREVTLQSLHQKGDEVELVLQHKDGTQETVTSPWVVGCDGARSTVRAELKLPFEGSTFEQRLLQADIKADFPFPVDPHEAIAFIAPSGPLGFLPLLSEGRYRLIVIGVEEHQELQTPKLEDFEALVKDRCPAGVKVYDPAWMIGFRFHGRIVPKYRVGRVFLAGDAAHIHSPVGAQGMNLGIQDAFNLAWKLAYVIRGFAQPGLLDSYEHERRPIGLATVQTTDRATKNMMRVMTLRSPIAQYLRNQAVSFLFNSGLFQNFIFGALSGTRVHYPKSPAVGEHHISGWSVQLGAGRDGEAPNYSDWKSFNEAPGPGDRVPDLAFEEELEGFSSLFSLLRGSQHTLLLFDGVSTKEGYQNLDAIAQMIQAKYQASIKTYVVVPQKERPSELRWSGPVLLDPEWQLHHHFGSNSESFYLIRPDGRVAFRSQPAHQEALQSYLEAFFVEGS